MAFEIFNGTTASNTPQDMNEILDKLIEMWGKFDSVDQTSTYHSATYGNATIRVNSQGGRFNLYNEATSSNVKEGLGYYNQRIYTIVKSTSTIMLALGAGSGSWDVWVISDATDLDGNIGKGIIGIDSSGSYYKWYSVVGNENQTKVQSEINDTLRTSQDVVQFIPYVSTEGGWCFNNAYRMIIGQNQTTKGKFKIGLPTYYIASRTAIRED